MSSSIIEAKFQALDRTIRLLNKTSLRAKVSSSDQLRELVNSQRSQATHRWDDCKPRVRTEDRPSTARPASSHGSVSDRRPPVVDVAVTWEEPAWRQKSMGGNPGTPQDAWNESANYDREGSAESSPEQSPQEYAEQQCQLGPAPSRSRSGTMCRALDNQNEDSRMRPIKPRPRSSVPQKSLLQTLSPSMNDAGAGPPRRNWFAPPPQRPSSSKKKPTRHRIAPQDAINETSSKADTGRPLVETPASHRSLSSTTEPDPLPDMVNEAAFYFLEVRLDHPTPLLDWRFRVLFTDLTLPTRPSVTVNNVPVDEQNVLLFTGPAHSIIRYFDPVRHFPHIKHPRDLYGHCVRILVHSTTPVQRVVIDTLVHFLVEVTSCCVNPPPPSVSQQPDPPIHLEPGKLELILPRPDPLPLDEECSGWEVDDSMPQDDAYLSPHRLAVSPRYETGCPTTDKKKAELKQIRAAMTRKMRDERQQLRQELPPTRRS